jgi:flagellar basal body-associated protein FliL
VEKALTKGGLMIKKRRTVYILIVLAVLLSIATYLGFVYWPFQAKERPTMVYFYSGADPTAR